MCLVSWDFCTDYDESMCFNVLLAVNYVLALNQWILLSVFGNYITSYVTLDHKTRHKGLFFYIENYTSSESWITFILINFPLMYGLLGYDPI